MWPHLRLLRSEQLHVSAIPNNRPRRSGVERFTSRQFDHKCNPSSLTLVYQWAAANIDPNYVTLVTMGAAAPGATNLSRVRSENRRLGHFRGQARIRTNSV